MGHRILYIPKPGNQIYYPEYGLLYNWYAVTDVRNITSSDDWTVANRTQLNSLSTYLGGNSVSGGKLKETGTTYWLTPNTGATNEKGFNSRGSGYRVQTTGAFSTPKADNIIWTSTSATTTNAYYLATNYNTGAATAGTISKIRGMSIRLVRNATGVSDGVTGTYTGNDGKVYRTIVINQLEYLADALSETRFRDGSIITWYGANQANYFTNAEWIALTTAGCCAFANTLSNVGPNFSFPT